MKRLFKGIDMKSADLVQTILASQDIPVFPQRAGSGRVDIRVRFGDEARAVHHLDLYARENADLDVSARIPLSPMAPGELTAFFLTPAMIAAAGFLALIHFILVRYHLLDQAIFAFGASPYFLGQGDTFRAVTALLLHADTGHLLGNMAGLLILGSPLVRVTGNGTGLFFMLAAAVAANLVSNSLGMDTRLSIGASTAVMAAAGLLAANQAVARLSTPSAAAPWLPLASGALLMALFSQGERTDILAHALGFVSGAFTGFLVFPLFSVWHRPFMEPVCLVLVTLIICSAGFMGAGFF